MKRIFFICLAILLMTTDILNSQWSVGYNTTHNGTATIEHDEPNLVLSNISGGSDYGHFIFSNDVSSNFGRVSYTHAEDLFEIGKVGEAAAFTFNSGIGDITSDPNAVGAFVIGKVGDDVKGYLSMDMNEIQARRGIQESTLYLNYRGGDVILGRNEIFYDANSHTLGIGIQDTRGYKVSIAGEDAALKLDANHPRLQFNNGAEELGYLRTFNSDLFFINQKEGKSYFGNNNATMMTLDERGYLGVGAYAPEVPLHIKKNSSELLRLENTGNDYTSLDFYYSGLRKAYIVNTEGSMFYINQGTGDTFIGNRGLPQMVIRGDGNVGLGSFTPTSKLEVMGNGNFTGELTAASDLKLKKDIAPIQDANEILSQLNPVTYQFKTDEFPDMNLSKNRRWGLIAQEVAQVLPELVSDQNIMEHNGDKEEYLSLNYIDLIPIMVKAFQENQSEINLLKTKIKALKE